MFGLDLIKKLKPAVYFYNDKIENLNNGKKHFGLIAQDIKEVLPMEDYSVVQKKGNYLAVNYIELISPMIKAMQEMSSEIETLKNEIEILKNEKRS
jgi:hypothetical protein